MKEKYVNEGDCFLQYNPILVMQLMKVHEIKNDSFGKDVYVVTIIYFSCGVFLEEHTTLSQDDFELAHYDHISEEIFNKGLTLARTMIAAVSALPKNDSTLLTKAQTLQDQAESAIVKILAEEDLIDEDDFEYDKKEYHPNEYNHRAETLLKLIGKL